MPRHQRIARLEEHPNLAGILAVLAQLAHIGDDDVVALAKNWHNTVHVAEARRQALSPDAPLIVEVLAAFDALSALFADDLAGRGDYVRVDPAVTTTALKAVRDAVAAAYARPVLSRGGYHALMAPWRTVYPRPTVREPDLGPAADEVKLLLGVLPILSGRCHDGAGRRAYDGLLVTAMTHDEREHRAAIGAAFRAAVTVGRRRVWTLIRRSAAEGLGRHCGSCARRSPAEDACDDRRVFELCADALCALLVRDVLDAGTAALLIDPVAHLVPLQRRPAEGAGP